MADPGTSEKLFEATAQELRDTMRKKKVEFEKEKKNRSGVRMQKERWIVETKSAGDVDGAASGASEERRREKRENGRRSRFGGRIFS